MVSRREFAISLGALAAPLVSLAQLAKIPRIGYLQAVAPQNGTSPFLGGGLMSYGPNLDEMLRRSAI